MIFIAGNTPSSKNSKRIITITFMYFYIRI